MEPTNASHDEHQQWLQHTYKGNTLPEFTAKALITGVLVGALLMASNVYVGLKTGIIAGGSIFAAMLTFVVLRSFRMSFSVLENNIAQTVASAAASIGIIVAVPPALIMLGYEISVSQFFFWLLSVSFLGVLFAVPLRRQSIVVDKLPFPSGTACAETITAMHADARDAVKKGKALGLSSFLSSVVVWFRDAIPSIIPGTTFLPGKVGGIGFNQMMVGIGWNPLLFGVGMLIGPRIGISLLIGTILAWGIFSPMLLNLGVVEIANYQSIRGWTMWPAIGMMVAAGITSLLMRGKIFMQTMRSMRDVSLTSEGELEFPFKSWLMGLVLCSVALGIIMQTYFHVPFWMSLLAIPLSFILVAVAVRTYGEMDFNPAAPMGWTTQITFGALDPTKATTNVMTGGVTAAASTSAGDMMGDLKTGYLLGATPRRQTYSQFIGVFLGICIALPVFYLLTSTYQLGSAELPAPAAISWSGIANIIVGGLKVLPPYSTTGILVGIIAGIALMLGTKTGKGHYLPSPIGIGIAMIIPAIIALPIFLGSMIAVVLRKISPSWSEKYLISIASGAIAGEAIMGIIISILKVWGVI